MSKYRLICKICGKPFIGSRKNQVTCSQECQKKNINKQFNHFVGGTCYCVVCKAPYKSTTSNQVTCHKPECIKQNKLARQRERRARPRVSDIGIKLLRLPGHECPPADMIDDQAAEFDQSIIYLCPICGAPFVPYVVDNKVIDKCPDCMKTAIMGKHFSRGKLQPTPGVTIGGMV
jgi:hypothetical protein